MSRNRSPLTLATVVVLSSVLASSTVALAGGGGPATSTVRQMIKRSIVASAAMKSVHIQGSAMADESVTSKGFSLSIGASATFHGDVSGRGKPAARIHGQVRILNQAKYFKLVAADNSVAAKIGKTKWQCSQLPASGSRPVVNGKGLLLIREWIRHLESPIHYATVGSTEYAGVPVWHVRAALVERVDLTPLLGIATISSSGSGGSIKVPSSQRIPKPWVHLKVNLWISRLNYTLQRATVGVKVREKQSSILLGLKLNLSRYGQHVPINLPTACNKGR